MSKYYYLIAGLADLSFDEGFQLSDMDGIRQEIIQGVSGADRRLLELPLLENDCRRLAALLEGKDIEGMPSGLMDGSLLQETIDSAKADEACPADVPAFMYDIACNCVQTDSVKDMGIQDMLLVGFYKYGMACGNPFVHDWFEFNLDLNNVRVAMTARKYGLDIRKAVTGDNETAQQLRSSGARDWGLSGQLDFFDELQRISEEQDLTRREKMIDMMRWRWLEANSFSSFFSVEVLFSYLERLSMVQRWSTMDHEGGEKLLRGLIQELKGQVSVPDEFKNN